MEVLSHTHVVVESEPGGAVMWTAGLRGLEAIYLQMNINGKVIPAVFSVPSAQNQQGSVFTAGDQASLISSNQILAPLIKRPKSDINLVDIP